MKQQGYTLAGALALIAIMSILMALSLPIWSRVKLRDNEEELIFRGKEYVEAIARYHARFHSFPADLETLYKQKFIRKLYKDPMTKTGEWKVLHPDSLVQTGAAGQINQPGQQKEENEPGQIPGSFGKDQAKTEKENPEDSEAKSKDVAEEEPETESTGPVVGVVSRSGKTSIRIYNNQNKYNKWVFVFTPQQQEQAKPLQDGQPGKSPKSGSKDQPKPVKKPSFQQQGNTQEKNP